MAADDVTPPEIWKPVGGYEGLFEVSNQGRVRSLDRVVPAGRGGQRRVPGRILKPWANASGHPAVKLESGGRHTSRAIHVLIQEAFGILPAMQPVPNAGEPERWLPVIGYEGLYSVSDLGRVRSFHAGPGGKRGGLLQPAPTGVCSHLCVVLCKDGKHKTRLVHQLVLEAFVGLRPIGQEALHGPGGGSDNRLLNLSWGTPEQNQGPDRVRDGTSNRGARAWKANLTEETVLECRRRHAAGESLGALASEFGCTFQGMRSAVRGITWAWLPGAVEPESRGKLHAAKLTAEIVMECRARYANGEDAYALAREFGVARPTMHQAIAGRTWGHI